MDALAHRGWAFPSRMKKEMHPWEIPMRCLPFSCWVARQETATTAGVGVYEERFQAVGGSAVHSVQPGLVTPRTGQEPMKGLDTLLPVTQILQLWSAWDKQRLEVVLCGM